MKKAAVIHDLSGFGKCSLTAAIPVLSALGVQCCPVATAVLTGQTGYPCYHCTDLTAMLPDYIDAWGKNNAHFDAIYSGFLTGAKQISQVLDFIRYFREEHTLLLVDPVMGDDGNAYPFFTPGLLNGMKELTLEADVITPNLTEACLLADIPEDALLHCRTNTDLLKLAEDVALRLQKKASHPQDVVITGVKCRDEKHPFIILLPLQMEFTGTNRRFLTGVFPEPGICLPLYCVAAAQRAYARKMRFCLPGNFYPTVSGIP